MKTLINWRAKRAGGRITIYGTDRDTNTPMKAVGIDTIEGAGSGAAQGFACPVATDKDGNQFVLA